MLIFNDLRKFIVINMLALSFFRMLFSLLALIAEDIYYVACAIC